MGNLPRLREVFASDPGLAGIVTKFGSLLFYVPDDEDLALEVTELLLAHGTDPTVKGADGRSASEALERRGLEEVAELLKSRS
jgi:hypothetical protein